MKNNLTRAKRPAQASKHTAFSPELTALSALTTFLALLASPALWGCSKDKSGEAEKSKKRQKSRPSTNKGARVRASRAGGEAKSGAKTVTKTLVGTWTQPLKADESTPPDPGRKKLASFKLTYGPKVYTPDNLYELLNGGADLYVKEGLKDLAHFRLKPKSGSGAECRVSMFFMQAPKNAQSLLAKEKAPEMKKAEVGDAAWSDKEGALVQKGRVMVRLESVAPDADADPCPFVALAKVMVAEKTVGWTNP